MPQDEAVSDTSPLLNLALIGRVDLLEDQFSSLLAPEQVMEELRQGEEGVEPVEELVRKGVLETVKVEEDNLFRELHRELDRGETATIRYAIREDVETVLIDEKEGREAARRHGLRPAGVIGILMQAYKDSERFKDTLDDLREKGFWISEKLYREVLDMHRDL